MKFLKSKFLMPVLAVTFALTASAFTAIDNSSADDNAIQGFVFDDNSQLPCNTVEVECDITGSELCKYEGKQVYRFASGTMCTSELWRN